MWSFASIDHDILCHELARVIRCQPTLALAQRIIAASNPQEEVLYYFPGDTLFTPLERRRGLPLGNQTSQFFANVYLNPLDQFLDRQRRPAIYARYVDDWVLFSDSPAWLDELQGAVEFELTKLRLVLHPGKSRVYRCADGITFLGWWLFPHYARLTRDNIIRTQRRLRRLQDAFAAGERELERVAQSVRAWLAHASHGDTEFLRETILARYPFRATGVEPIRAGRRFQQQCKGAPGGISKQQERT